MRSVCYERVWPVEEFSANGEQCLNRLCQLRGQAHSLTRNQSLVFILGCIGVVGVLISFVAWRFPDFWSVARRPRLRITKFELIQQTNTGTPGVNVFFRVEGAGAKLVDSSYRIVVTTFPGDEREVELENSLFDGMLEKITPDKSMGETPAGTELYVTLIGTPVPDEVWEKVRAKTAAVYFMGRFKYSDNGVAYHSDYCGFFMGDPAPIFMCHYHNTEP